MRAEADARERAVDDFEAALAEARREPDAILDGQALLALEREQEDVRGAVEELRGRRGELTAERRALAAQPGIADAAGEAAALAEQLVDVMRARDRLALASSVLREAERRYREANGPGFLRTAGIYLAAITGGRYERIVLADAIDGQRLELVPSMAGPPVPVVHPLSRGTLEQVHLAMRLALVDEIDPERILPLFLDESFVHWDAGRLAGVVPLLAATGGRQIVLTTCHATIAGALQGAGAHVIALQGSGDGAALSPVGSSTAIP
jgi:uncharacterized protein YhaN